MKQINIIKNGKIFALIGLATIATCIIIIFVLGIKPGIDFTGGTLVELRFSQNRPQNIEVDKLLQEKVKLSSSVLQTSGEKELIIRSRFLSESEHRLLLSEMKSKFGTKDNIVTERRFETIGAAVSQQLRSRAIYAVILVVLSIVTYVGYAFRKVSRPVASWKYGILAIVALMHDVLLVLAVFAILGRTMGVEVNIPIVVAMLTVLGYSVNDTIVVYDRIRENLLKTRWEVFGDVVNKGLNQSLMRSFNTTVTTLIPLIALYFAGGTTIHYFSLALIIGIASGAYSSIFIASPMLVFLEKWKK